MAFEFVARNGIIALNNTTISGSLSVTNSVSGSIFTGSFIGTLTGTSSFSTSGSQAISASFATSASNALTASYVNSLNQNVSITGSLTVSGSAAFNSIGTSNFTGSTAINYSPISSAESVLTLRNTLTSVTGNETSVLALDTSLATNAVDIRLGNSGNPVALRLYASSTPLTISPDGAGFQAFTNTHPSFPGRIYIDSGANDNAALVFRTAVTSGNITERFRISSAGTSSFSGNVGINTFSPSASLHISGTTGTLLQTTNDVNTGLFVSSSGQVGIGTTNPQSRLEVGNIGSAGTTDYGALTLSSGSSGLTLGWDSTNSRSYIYSRTALITSRPLEINGTIYAIGFGNVGIGTSSPTAKLHVSGTSGALLQTTSGSNTGLYVSSSGQVGINTVSVTNTNTALHVLGLGTTEIIRMAGATSTSNPYLSWYQSTTRRGYIQLINSGYNLALVSEFGSLSLWTGNNSNPIQRVTVTSSGSVGINTTSPNATLDVSGSVLVSGSLAVSGSAAITGSIGVTGTITAQTLIVQTVSSSIIYSSGSNIFGNKATDTQQFTGSVLVSGSITVSGSVVNNLTASYASNADLLDGSHLSQLATTGSNIFRGTQSITGSLIVSSSNANTASLSVIGTGSGVFTVDGTSGRLFSVDDSLSGSLFSVNTAAGLPLMEAFSDNTVRIGQFGKKALFVSQSAIGIGKETGINGVLDISGSSVNVTGSLNVFGTVINNLTASYAISASYASNFSAGYARTFAQVTPAVTWSFSHNLNSFTPIVQVYDLGYNQIIPATIVNTSLSGSSIYFATAQAGYAVMSTGGITITGSNAILSQTTPAATWSFYHGLNTQFPVFTVFDSSNNVIMPLQINATNANSASIYFSTPQIGTVVAANGGVGAAASNNATASFTNSSTWTFNHNLNRQNVIIQTYDASYNQIIPQNVQLTSINTATITFPTNTSGYAIASIGGVTGQAVSASYAFTSSYVLPLNQTVTITGSLLVSGSGTFRNIGPAAFTGSTAMSGALNVIGDVTGSNFLTTGTITAQTIVVQVISSSIDFITGSTKTGTLASNTHQFTGSLFITGGLSVTTGSVGIGTTNPTANLEISAATGTQLKIATNDATAANNSGIFFYNEASATAGTRRSYMLLDPNGANAAGGDYSYFDMLGSGTARVMNQLTAGVLALGVGGTNVINITGSNVGIGTSTPATKFEIADANGVALRFGDIASYPSNQTAGYIGMSTSAFSGINGDIVLIPRTNASARILLMSGSVGIGTTSTSTEGNLFLGANGASEGGQLVLQSATSYISASHLDNYQDQFRVMSGTNVGSNTVRMNLSMVTGQLTVNNYATMVGGTFDVPASTTKTVTVSLGSGNVHAFLGFSSQSGGVTGAGSKSIFLGGTTNDGNGHTPTVISTFSYGDQVVGTGTINTTTGFTFTIQNNKASAVTWTWSAFGSFGSITVT